MSAVQDVHLVVVEDVEAAARATAERLAHAASAGESIVLTGGRTPGLAYELAAELEPDWGRVTLWWGDERCVPPDDEDSNFRLAKETLLERLGRSPAAIHRIHGELGAEEAAAVYDRLLEGAALDLLLLGLGPDGHLASLFPNEPTLEERKRRAIPAEPKLEPFVERVTMTIPVLRSARKMLFLVTGAEKADAVARAFAAPPSRETPASLVRAESGSTTAILDRAAASCLPM